MTDANLVLGYLDPANFLGGRRSLDLEAATRRSWRASAERTGDRRRRGGGRHPSPGQHPHGRRRARRDRAARRRSARLYAAGVWRRGWAARHRGRGGTGHRPGGGAARRLGAVGLGDAEHRSAGGTQPQLRRRPASLDTAALQRRPSPRWRTEGRARLAWFDGEVTLHRSADMRYGEQVFEIPVGLDDVDWASPAMAADLAESIPRGARDAVHLRAARPGGRAGERAPVGDRPAASVERAVSQTFRDTRRAKGAASVCLGGWTEVPVFDFLALGADQAFVGRPSSSPTPRPSCCAAAMRHVSIARGWLDVTVDGSGQHRRNRASRRSMTMQGDTTLNVFWQPG